MIKDVTEATCSCGAILTFPRALPGEMAKKWFVVDTEGVASARCSIECVSKTLSGTLWNNRKARAIVMTLEEHCGGPVKHTPVWRRPTDQNGEAKPSPAQELASALGSDRDVLT